MKKFIILAFTILLGGTVGYAQDYERLDKFLREYGSNWRHGYQEQAADGQVKTVNQLGMPAPRYSFSKELNSKKLKGKFVIMNFWSTWCGGCRALCQDLDSIMVKGSDEYRDVQIIGVNYKENLVDKGYKAREWWEQKAFGYPTTDDNKGVEEFSTAVHAGHPTMMLIDDRGIIRGRWDAWSPGTAANAALAVWVLKIVPQQGVTLDLDLARQYMKEKNYLRVLYILEGLPETDETRLMKLEALLHESSYQAGIFIGKLMENAKEQANYGMLLGIAQIVERTEVYSSFCKIGLEAVSLHNRQSKRADDDSWMLEYKLKFRYGKQMQMEAERAIDERIRIYGEDKSNKDELSVWEQARKELK